MIPLEHYVYLASLLFVIGIVGVLYRRNALIVFMSVELMLNAVNLLLTAFSTYRNDPAGQVFVFFIMAVAAAEVSVGLAIIVLIYRNVKSIDINLLNKLKW
jgi:NADH-quinone oxidoreductase subunit K